MGRLLVVLFFLWLQVPQSIADSVATVQTGLLGEDFVQIGSARKLTTAVRRLNIATTPGTVFIVEDCASIAGLSSGKKSTLATKSITRCINVFGALVAGHSGVTSCGAENNMIFLANSVAELLDTKLEGKPTDANVVNNIKNFDDASANAFLLAGCTQSQEEFEPLDPPALGSSFSSQAPNVDAADAPATLLEEAFHFIHQKAWAKAYAPFADTWTSNLGLCVKAAQCTWYMHDENAGCSDASGAKCLSATDPKVPCTGACAAFNTAGQCYADVAGSTCAMAHCDVVEFFHKVYLGYIEDPTMTGNYYQKMVDSGANSKAGITTKMQSTPACTQVLQDMQNSAYALPTNKFTGAYTTALDTTAPAPAPAPVPLPAPADVSFAFGITCNSLVLFATFLQTAWQALQ